MQIRVDVRRLHLRKGTQEPGDDLFASGPMARRQDPRPFLRALDTRPRSRALSRVGSLRILPTQVREEAFQDGRLDLAPFVLGADLLNIALEKLGVGDPMAAM